MLRIHGYSPYHRGQDQKPLKYICAYQNTLMMFGTISENLGCGRLIQLSQTYKENLSGKPHGWKVSVAIVSDPGEGGSQGSQAHLMILTR